MNVEYMSSEDDMDLATLIIKIGSDKIGKYFKDIPKYLNKKQQELVQLVDFKLKEIMEFCVIYPARKRNKITRR